MNEECRITEKIGKNLRKNISYFRIRSLIFILSKQGVLGIWEIVTVQNKNHNVYLATMS